MSMTEDEWRQAAFGAVCRGLASQNWQKCGSQTSENGGCFYRPPAHLARMGIQACAAGWLMPDSKLTGYAPRTMGGYVDSYLDCIMDELQPVQDAQLLYELQVLHDGSLGANMRDRYVRYASGHDLIVPEGC